MIKQEIEKPKTIAWAVWSIICGIAGLPTIMMPYFGLPLSIMAIVFHIQQQKNYPLSISYAGLIMGIIGVVLNTITGIMLAGILLLAFM